MNAAVPAGAGTVLIFLALAAYSAHYHRSNRELRPHRVVTGLPAARLREIFAASVGGSGWSIVDLGNPLVARSFPITGIRQEIQLWLEERDGRTHATLTVTRHAKKLLGGAERAHTLHGRMAAFLSQVRDADAAASTAG